MSIVHDSGARRKKRSGGLLMRWLRWKITALLVVTTILVVLFGIAIVVGRQLLQNPVKTVTIDRSPPPVLLTLKDLALYKAAEGQYEVIIDVEKDVQYVPSVIAGERTLFVGVGSVEATVDFRDLGPEAVNASDDRSSVVITLPRAQLSPAMVDPAKSRVASQQRGVVDRIADAISSDPKDLTPLFTAAGTKIDGAAGTSNLRERAEENTRQMLTSLATQLGYTKVEVRFVDRPGGPPTTKDLQK
jgi:hypothetical protein